MSAVHVDQAQRTARPIAQDQDGTPGPPQANERRSRRPAWIDLEAAGQQAHTWPATTDGRSPTPRRPAADTPPAVPRSSPRPGHAMRRANRGFDRPRPPWRPIVRHLAAPSCSASPLPRIPARARSHADAITLDDIGDTRPDRHLRLCSAARRRRGRSPSGALPAMPDKRRHGHGAFVARVGSRRGNGRCRAWPSSLVAGSARRGEQDLRHAIQEPERHRIRRSPAP